MERRSTLKVFDVIHGWIEIDGLALDFFRLPEVQRLKRIRQCGNVAVVSINGAGTRLEHVVGTYHVTKMLLQNIQHSQAELGLTNRHVELVSLGALLHDIGQVFFGHAFDKQVLPVLAQLAKCREEQTEAELQHQHQQQHQQKQKEPTMSRPACKLVEHELRSARLVEVLVKRYGLQDKILVEELRFVQDVITGTREPYSNSSRLGQKFPVFLLDVVCNTIADLDTDKIDYLMRDSHYLMGHPACGRVLDLAKAARVVDGQLCYNLLHREEIYDVFEARLKLHQRFYQTPEVVVADVMMMRVLELCADQLQLLSMCGDWEECSWTDLTDDVFWCLKLHPETPPAAVELMRRLETGQLLRHSLRLSSVPVVSDSADMLSTSSTASVQHLEGRNDDDDCGHGDDAVREDKRQDVPSLASSSPSPLPNTEGKIYVERTLSFFGGRRTDFLCRLPYFSERPVSLDSNCALATDSSSYRFVGFVAPVRTVEVLKLSGFVYTLSLTNSV